MAAAEQHHGHQQGLNGVALSATLHCLTGCALGEVAGMIIGTAFGLSNGVTVMLAIVLAFVFGYTSRACRCCGRASRSPSSRRSLSHRIQRRSR